VFALCRLQHHRSLLLFQRKHPKILTQIDPPPADLSVADIRWQIAAEWSEYDHYHNGEHKGNHHWLRSLTPCDVPFPQMGVPNAPLVIIKFSNGHISATDDLIHFMFGLADRMALFPVRSNFKMAVMTWRDKRYRQQPSYVAFCQITLSLVTFGLIPFAACRYAKRGQVRWRFCLSQNAGININNSCRILKIIEWETDNTALLQLNVNDCRGSRRWMKIYIKCLENSNRPWRNVQSHACYWYFSGLGIIRRYTITILPCTV